MSPFYYREERVSIKARVGRQIAFHANATSHSIARPTACGSRVPPQRIICFGNDLLPCSASLLRIFTASLAPL